MKKLSVILAAISFLTSCTKESTDEFIQNTNITFGFQIAGVPVVLSFGNGATGLYYPQSGYGSYVYGGNSTNMTARYVMSSPVNSEAVAVFDRTGLPIGTVRCDQGVGSNTNQIFLSLKNWFVQHPNTPCIVLVRWDPRPFTTGRWEGTIVG